MLLAAGAGHEPLRSDDWRAKLTDSGKRAAQRYGSMLAERGWLPDVALASGAAALATAEKALKAAGTTTSSLRIYDSVSPDDVSGLLDDIGDVLVVGGADDLVAIAAHFDALCGGAPFSRLEVRGAHGLVRVQVRADELPEDFPFPAPGAVERRSRPAYYYTQSAAVPFRQTERGLEVLVIGSSGGRHRVVPKGIVEPGLSAAESALKEAREEAGVRGEIVRSLGDFQYDKWGAACSCTVFAMEVSEELAEGNWEEAHRGREWMSAAEASRALRVQALADIVARLPEALAEATSAANVP